MCKKNNDRLPCGISKMKLPYAKAIKIMYGLSTCALLSFPSINYADAVSTASVPSQTISFNFGSHGACQGLDEFVKYLNSNGINAYYNDNTNLNNKIPLNANNISTYFTISPKGNLCVFQFKKRSKDTPSPVLELQPNNKKTFMGLHDSNHYNYEVASYVYASNAQPLSVIVQGWNDDALKTSPNDSLYQKDLSYVDYNKETKQTQRHGQWLATQVYYKDPKNPNAKQGTSPANSILITPSKELPTVPSDASGLVYIHIATHPQKDAVDVPTLASQENLKKFPTGKTTQFQTYQDDTFTKGSNITKLFPYHQLISKGDGTTADYNGAEYKIAFKQPGDDINHGVLALVPGSSYDPAIFSGAQLTVTGKAGSGCIHEGESRLTVFNHPIKHSGSFSFLYTVPTPTSNIPNGESYSQGYYPIYFYYGKEGEGISPSCTLNNLKVVVHNINPNGGPDVIVDSPSEKSSLTDKTLWNDFRNYGKNNRQNNTVVTNLVKNWLIPSKDWFWGDTGGVDSSNVHLVKAKNKEEGGYLQLLAFAYKNSDLTTFNIHTPHKQQDIEQYENGLFDSSSTSTLIDPSLKDEQGNPIVSLYNHRTNGYAKKITEVLNKHAFPRKDPNTGVDSYISLRSGSAIESRYHLGYGQYVECVKLPQNDGASFAAWAYNSQYLQKDNASYWNQPGGQRNAEIDMEFNYLPAYLTKENNWVNGKDPTQETSEPGWADSSWKPQTSFDVNSWGGEQGGSTGQYHNYGYADNLSDGKFHLIGFDWSPQSIRFYVDQSGVDCSNNSRISNLDSASGQLFTSSNEVYHKDASPYLMSNGQFSKNIGDQELSNKDEDFNSSYNTDPSAPSAVPSVMQRYWLGMLFPLNGKLVASENATTGNPAKGALSWAGTVNFPTMGATPTIPNTKTGDAVEQTEVAFVGFKPLSSANVTWRKETVSDAADLPIGQYPGMKKIIPKGKFTLNVTSDSSSDIKGASIRGFSSDQSKPISNTAYKGPSTSSIVLPITSISHVGLYTPTTSSTQITSCYGNGGLSKYNTKFGSDIYFNFQKYLASSQHKNKLYIDIQQQHSYFTCKIGYSE